MTFLIVFYKQIMVVIFPIRAEDPMPVRMADPVADPMANQVVGPVAGLVAAPVEIIRGGIEKVVMLWIIKVLEIR